MDIGTWIGLGVAVVLLVVLFARGRRPPEVTAGPAARSELDAWIEEALARELAKKLDRPEDQILGVLRGDPDPDAVSAIEDAVRGVKITYSRLATEGSFEVRAEITFEDGATAHGSKPLSHEELPDAIRVEFLRTGGAYVFRDWHFPWYGPDRGWS
jgi:hypothetical protein